MSALIRHNHSRNDHDNHVRGHLDKDIYVDVQGLYHDFCFHQDDHGPGRQRHGDLERKSFLWC